MEKTLMNDSQHLGAVLDAAMQRIEAIDRDIRMMERGRTELLQQHEGGTVAHDTWSRRMSAARDAYRQRCDELAELVRQTRAEVEAIPSAVAREQQALAAVQGGWLDELRTVMMELLSDPHWQQVAQRIEAVFEANARATDGLAARLERLNGVFDQLAATEQQIASAQRLHAGGLPTAKFGA